jgi:hypothetical protein
MTPNDEHGRENGSRSVANRVRGQKGTFQAVGHKFHRHCEGFSPKQSSVAVLFWIASLLAKKHSLFPAVSIFTTVQLFSQT